MEYWEKVVADEKQLLNSKIDNLIEAYKGYPTFLIQVLNEIGDKVGLQTTSWIDFKRITDLDNIEPLQQV